MSEESLRVELTAAPVRTEVVHKLRAAIVGGRFAAGQRLRERDLCELTGVSRTPVREALRQLETEGLVEVVPNRGPVVATPTVRDIRDVFQLRDVLEGLAARLFAVNATAEQRSSLRESLDAIAFAVDAGDLEGIPVLKDHFYGIMLEGSGNVLAARTLAGLFARIAALRVATLARPGRPRQALDELTEIVEAVEAGDGDRAERAGRAHVAAAAAIALTINNDHGAASSGQEDLG